MNLKNNYQREWSCFVNANTHEEFSSAEFDAGQLGPEEFEDLVLRVSIVNKKLVVSCFDHPDTDPEGNSFVTTHQDEFVRSISENYTDYTFTVNNNEVALL